MALAISLQFCLNLSRVSLAQNDILKTKQSQGVARFVVGLDSYALFVQITLGVKLDILLLLLLWLKTASTPDDEKLHEILDDVPRVEIVEKAYPNANC